MPGYGSRIILRLFYGYVVYGYVCHVDSPHVVYTRLRYTVPTFTFVCWLLLVVYVWLPFYVTFTLTLRLFTLLFTLGLRLRSLVDLRLHVTVGSQLVLHLRLRFGYVCYTILLIYGCYILRLRLVYHVCVCGYVLVWVPTRLVGWILVCVYLRWFTYGYVWLHSLHTFYTFPTDSHVWLRCLVYTQLLLHLHTTFTVCLHSFWFVCLRLVTLLRLRLFVILPRLFRLVTTVAVPTLVG